MTSNINYKCTLFDRAKLTPIHGEITSKTLHKLRNEIKENYKYVYSNIGGGAHGHLGLVFTDAQYSHTPFVYPTHPGPLIIPDSKTAHANSNMRTIHTKEMCLFCEVTGVEQALVQQIVFTFEEEYLAYIRNKTTKSTKNTVAGVLTYLQDNYGQLMPHELLERDDIAKKTTYNMRNPIATVFSTVK